MEEFKNLITLITYAVEAFGVIVIVVGSFLATIRFVRHWLSSSPESAYHEYRLAVGRSIILGLEFLIAGDVIRTVIVSHTMSSVTVLALMVIIRAFLSFTLALEIEGRLPWEKSAKDQRSQG